MKFPGSQKNTIGIVFKHIRASWISLIIFVLPRGEGKSIDKTAGIHQLWCIPE